LSKLKLKNTFSVVKEDEVSFAFVKAKGFEFRSGEDEPDVF